MIPEKFFESPPKEHLRPLQITLSLRPEHDSTDARGLHSPIYPALYAMLEQHFWGIPDKKEVVQMQPNYQRTRLACYAAIISQAIQNNLPPLLFIVFQNQYHISFEMLGRLILLNFLTQLVVDLLFMKLADRIGYRRCMIGGQVCVILGFLCMAFLPMLLPNIYLGLMIGIMLTAIGGGLSEVLVSPIIEAIPSDEKAATMSMLHSFYCWGQVLTVLVSTLLLSLIGQNAWYVLPLCWVVMPLASILLYRKAPILPPLSVDKSMKISALFQKPVFLVAMVLMVCAGASELTMSQWSSLFAEKGLLVPKVVGDLMGPCLFAVWMGLGRALYGKFGSKIPLRGSLIGCALLCIFCYLLAALSPSPLLSLVGCALCGLSVSLMWPGALSMTAARFPFGGTALFALLAVMGDLGCSIGPWLAGMVSDSVQHIPTLIRFAASHELSLDQLGLKAGLLLGVLFPLVLLFGTFAIQPDGKE